MTFTIHVPSNLVHPVSPFGLASPLCPSCSSWFCPLLASPLCVPPRSLRFPLRALRALRGFFRLLQSPSAISASSAVPFPLPNPKSAIRNPECLPPGPFSKPPKPCLSSYCHVPYQQNLHLQKAQKGPVFRPRAFLLHLLSSSFCVPPPFLSPFVPFVSFVVLPSAFLRVRLRLPSPRPKSQMLSPPIPRPGTKLRSTMFLQTNPFAIPLWLCKV
jgi:hypothetical protein